MPSWHFLSHASYSSSPYSPFLPSFLACFFLSVPSSLTQHKPCSYIYLAKLLSLCPADGKQSKFEVCWSEFGSLSAEGSAGCVTLAELPNPSDHLFLPQLLSAGLCPHRPCYCNVSCRGHQCPTTAKSNRPLSAVLFRALSSFGLYWPLFSCSNTFPSAFHWYSSDFPNCYCYLLSPLLK